MAFSVDVRQVKTAGEYTGRVNQQINTGNRLVLPVLSTASIIYCEY